MRASQKPRKKGLEEPEAESVSAGGGDTRQETHLLFLGGRAFIVVGICGGLLPFAHRASALDSIDVERWFGGGSGFPERRFLGPWLSGLPCLRLLALVDVC